MVDEKQTDGEGSQPEKEPFSTSIGRDTGGALPESQSQPQAKKTSKASSYRQDVMRALKAISTWLWRIPRGIWGGVKIGFQFADAHDGAITALATVAIVVLTIFYVSYSKKQWEEMRSGRRPWVGMSERLTLKSPPSFTAVDAAIPSMDGETAFIMVRFNLSGTLQNFGSSPARRVATFFEPVQFNDFTDVRDIVCKTVEATTAQKPFEGTNFVSSALTKAIFPNVVIPVEGEAQTGTFAGAAHQLPNPIWIIGCVAYLDIFGEVHHTKVLYRSISVTDEWEIALNNPLLRYKAITEFVMEDSDSD